MQKSQEGRCFIEAQSSVHQRGFIIEVGRTISIQSHVLKNDLKEPNYGKSLISEKLRWDPIGVHWVAETSRTLEIRSLLANIFDETMTEALQGQLHMEQPAESTQSRSKADGSETKGCGLQRRTLIGR